MNIPIVVMTAFADVQSAVKSFKHGAKEYIQKPFTVTELDKVVRSLLSQKTEERHSSYNLQENVEQTEREAILRALKASGNVKAEAARLLKISERALWYKIKKYNI